MLASLLQPHIWTANLLVIGLLVARQARQSRVPVVSHAT